MLQILTGDGAQLPDSQINYLTSSRFFFSTFSGMLQCSSLDALLRDCILCTT